MNLLSIADALLLCASLLAFQRIIYPRAVGRVVVRVATLLILCSVWLFSRGIGREQVTTVAVVTACFICFAVGTQGEPLEVGVVALSSYLVAKLLAWFTVIIVGVFVYPLSGFDNYDVIVLVGRIVIHVTALAMFAILVKVSKFILDIRHHVKATVVIVGLLLAISFRTVDQPYENVGKEFFVYVLWVLFFSATLLFTAVLSDNKDGKNERKLTNERETAEAGRRAAEAAHRAAVKVSHDIKEDLQKHLREYRMEAASDAAPELPGRVVARTYRDMERRTSLELRDGKRLPRTGVPALDARLMRSLALAHGLDVDLDLMALAPIGGAVGRGVTADALAEAVGGVVDGAARAAAACDNPVRRVLLTVDMAGDLFPSIRIESTGAQFPEPDILKAVSQLLSPGGVSIEISADMLPGDIYEKAVHLLFDGEGRRVGSGLSETATV